MSDDDDYDLPRTPRGGVNQIVWITNRLDDHDRRLRSVEEKLAEHLGRCGNAGSFSIVEVTVRELKEDVDLLKGFRIRLLTYAAVGIVIGGIAVSVLQHGIAKLFGW